MITLRGVGPTKCHGVGLITSVLGTRVVGSGGTRGLVTRVGNTGDVTRIGGVTGTIDSSMGRVAFSTPTCISMAHTDRPTLNTCTDGTRMGGLANPVGNGTNICVVRICGGRGDTRRFSTGGRRGGLSGVTKHCTDDFVGSLCGGTRIGSSHCLCFWSMMCGLVGVGANYVG